MSHISHTVIETPDIDAPPCEHVAGPSDATEILITTDQVAFSTAIASTARPTYPCHPWAASRMISVLRRVRVTLPTPRPIYPRREAAYFEASRMSRELDHL